MKPPARWLAALRRESEVLGWPGLLIACFALLSLALGLGIWAQETDRVRRTSLETFRPILAAWIRTVPIDYLGSPLPDYVDRYKRSSPADRPARRRDLVTALDVLAAKFDPLIVLVRFDLIETPSSTPLASWPAQDPPATTETDFLDRIPILGEGDDPLRPGSVLRIQYRLTPELQRAARSLELSQRRLLLALLVLSCFPLLFLLYMALQARAVHDRISRVAAQQATLELADRTCHELGNMAFVLANEQRNLSHHLQLVDDFLALLPQANAQAASRAGLDPRQADKFAREFARACDDQGLSPTVELPSSLQMARDVCRQIALCSDDIALTVRELDSYLKQSSLPVRLEPIDARACVQDAVRLMSPRAQAAALQLQANLPDHPLGILADRRLLLHALVNLLKNAVEAASSPAASSPAIEVRLTALPTHATIEIADSGPGIPPELLSRLFEHGFSTKAPGRGRGLATVHHSIHQMAGTVQVDSTPHQGARFTLTLPRTPLPPPDP